MTLAVFCVYKDHRSDASVISVISTPCLYVRYRVIVSVVISGRYARLRQKQISQLTCWSSATPTLHIEPRRRGHRRLWTAPLRKAELKEATNECEL